MQKLKESLEYCIRALILDITHEMLKLSSVVFYKNVKTKLTKLTKFQMRKARKADTVKSLQVVNFTQSQSQSLSQS